MKKLMACVFFGMASLASIGASAGALTGGQMLHRGEDLYSDNGEYVLSLQAGDGNLVLRRRAAGYVMWSSYKPGGEVAKVQEDHNFVVYRAGALLPPNAIWYTNTAANVFDVGTTLTLGDDGYLRLTSGTGALLWTTAPRTPAPDPCGNKAQPEARSVCSRAGTAEQFQTLIPVCPRASIPAGFVAGSCPALP